MESETLKVARCIVCNDPYNPALWPHPTDCQNCAMRRIAVVEVELDGVLCAKRVPYGSAGWGESLAFARTYFKTLGYKVGPHLRRL